MHHLNSDLQKCIKDCTNCYQICLKYITSHCLQIGGEHSSPHHITLMLNCVEICQTCIKFMLTNSPLHHIICNACAQVCKACANECEKIGNMEECIKACRQCVETCNSMEHCSV